MSFFSPNPSHNNPHSITPFLQNCDLPPPHKLFFFSSSTSSSSFKHEWFQRMASSTPCMCMGGERRSTLRALQLCQTRAREAEKRSKKMADMLLRESVKLSAYKHWVKMLEIRVVVLENENENGKRLLFEHDDDDDDVDVSWCYVFGYICFWGCRDGVHAWKIVLKNL
ncbi:uncharacterized protein LOC120263187 [Dioscorea cayenensis subsp. rotundata]|uniref:Uncharacterized protein LOC120263187 n=1 Tax=Dioscorea cayennensis subsp. rotundata TaxID=55577 RepID=A0AB40BHY9_DIOCR|nr:uncharacterized protein LOC120263187 [Dioscorea cayenensis subsp. rotundata]